MKKSNVVRIMFLSLSILGLFLSYKKYKFTKSRYTVEREVIVSSTSCIRFQASNISILYKGKEYNSIEIGSKDCFKISKGDKIRIFYNTKSDEFYYDKKLNNRADVLFITLFFITTVSFFVSYEKTVKPNVDGFFSWLNSK